MEMFFIFASTFGSMNGNESFTLNLERFLSQPFETRTALFNAIDLSGFKSSLNIYIYIDDKTSAAGFNRKNEENVKSRGKSEVFLDVV